MDNNSEKKEQINSWLEEIKNETEHYYQGEIQEEQRASWILASVSVLLALFVGSQSLFTEYKELISGILILFLISGILAIITIIPIHNSGTGGELFGCNYKKEKEMNVSNLIKKKFKHSEDWSEESLQKRVFFHYRSHFLRARRKEIYVIWSTILFIFGIILLGLLGIIELFKN